ncbi:NAD-dependent epimerase/dehydratase family protein [Streptomyces sp. JL7001]|uniref:NAD-dependent epimerase/dehydratase family protein n=1 Tax=Streptomyces sp. JL7001 TaxID=3445784 RepID=UPI003F7A98EA
MTTVLIAGGAGYIGSTVASACTDAGITPVILDNLVRGRREFTSGRAFYEGDIADGALVDRIFSEHPDISAVVHCAALIVVPESVADPIGYYEANVAKSLAFVSHLHRNGCDRIIFSSSASIYRAEDGSSVNEDSPLAPQSPYARTKAVCEEMFADIAVAGPRVLSLRYFNPVGADPELRTGLQLKRPSHALGVLIQAHQEGRPFPITGTTYPTRDGTGIRDYVHVGTSPRPTSRRSSASTPSSRSRSARSRSTWAPAPAPPSGSCAPRSTTSSARRWPPWTPSRARVTWRGATPRATGRPSCWGGRRSCPWRTASDPP